MSAEGLRSRLDAYLALRRALGSAMRPDERLLRDFITFVEARGLGGPVRARAALEWATSTADRCGPGGQARRLSVARAFLAYLHAGDPAVDIPAPGVLRKGIRPMPHIYSATAIAALIDAARALGPHASLRPHTVATLIGLLTSTGLRPGEALRLRGADVDLDAEIPRLTVRQSKFRKSRIVPLHSTTAEALRRYAVQRAPLGYDGLCDSFFASERGTPLNYHVTARTFARLARGLGLRGPIGTRGASLHHLRHTFAVHRLVAWYRDGMDVRARLPELAVYLGHARPQDTYWYLTATPQLLEQAAERFARYAHRRETP
jgi:integrase